MYIKINSLNDPFDVVSTVLMCRFSHVSCGFSDVCTPPFTSWSEDAGSQNELPLGSVVGLTSMATNPNWRQSALFSNQFSAETCKRSFWLTRIG